MPSISQLKNLTLVMVQALQNYRQHGFLETDEATVDRRLETCAGCDRARIVGPVLRCEECGCIMNVKARLVVGRCPLGKWEFAV